MEVDRTVIGYKVRSPFDGLWCSNALSTVRGNGRVWKERDLKNVIASVVHGVRDRRRFGDYIVVELHSDGTSREMVLREFYPKRFVEHVCGECHYRDRGICSVHFFSGTERAANDPSCSSFEPRTGIACLVCGESEIGYYTLDDGRFVCRTCFGREVDKLFSNYHRKEEA